MEDVAKKLALLPEGLAEKNIESWKNTFLRYQKFYKTEYNEWVFPVLDLVQKIENTEQANLFRAGTSLYSLLISTAERHGMKDKEPFVSVFIERNIKPSISYWSNETKVIEQPLNPACFIRASSRGKQCSRTRLSPSSKLETIFCVPTIQTTLLEEKA